jgi:adhesin transport system membrane fusion protein
MSERLKKFADSARRTVIRSPTDGSVMTLFVVTRGGVVAPGGTVMTLVPGDDRLVVESKLPVSDVGFVQVGQRARLQLMASAGRRLHPLGGVVVHVSPDAISEPDKEPYVLVRIAPDADQFVGSVGTYRLSPGAHLRTSIVTGERSVLGYLLDPFMAGMHGAMTES